MAQIKPTDPRFRTKPEIVADIVFILQAPVTFAAKAAVIENAMWVWTEMDGKYQGCRYWTCLALVRFTESWKTGEWRKHLCHEHVVPKKVVMQMLLQLPVITPEAIFRICDKFLIGVVVDRLEDALLNEFRSSMPAEFFDPASVDFENPWVRYRHCKVTVLPKAPTRPEFDNYGEYLEQFRLVTHPKS